MPYLTATGIIADVWLRECVLYMYFLFFFCFCNLWILYDLVLRVDDGLCGRMRLVMLRYQCHVRLRYIGRGLVLGI